MSLKAAPQTINAKLFMALSLLLMLFTQDQAFAHGMSDAEKSIAISGSLWDYIKLGITHMLTGYDHLAFVFGIIFFLTSFRKIATYITAFTLGHSATLIYATFNQIQINHYLIDAIIGLSVAFIGFYNLGGFEKWLKIKAPNMLACVFIIGLIHGFGLSTLLQKLPLNPDHLLGNIISFNIGIELGQLAALALMLGILTLLRKQPWFPSFSTFINGLLILAGFYFCAVQLSDYAASENSTLTAPKTQEPKGQSTWQDIITVTVPANSGIEKKVTMAKGAQLTYEWATSKGEALYFDFHGEPKGDTTGYFKSYKVATDKTYQGTLTAPFEGTHGWYWKNETAAPVRVELKLQGTYTLK